MVGVGLAIAAATGVVIYLRWPKPLDCETAVRQGKPNDVALVRCRDEYERTNEPSTGLRIVDMLRRTDSVAARSLATRLLATEVRSDAYTLLGEIALTDGRLNDALDALLEARKLHREEGRGAAVARDASAVAGVHASRGQFAEALTSLDECIVEAQAASARSTEGLCHVAAARTLLLVGRFDTARRELDQAEQMASTDSERARLWLERGNIAQAESRGKRGASHGERAVAAFEKAFGFATSAGRMDLVLSLHLNLAYSYASLDRLDEAERHHKAALDLDLDRRYESELEQLAARIAYRRGHLGVASALNERLYAKMPPGDDRFEVCVEQTRILLAMNDLVDAQQWARRAIEDVEKIRAAQVSVELRPWVLASRRAPYELLFVVLARMGRLEEAVLVLDQWQGRTLLDAMSRPKPDSAPDLEATASMLKGLGRWLPAVSTAPLISARSSDAVEVLRSIDLWALAVAEDEVWRVVARRGQIRIDKIGTYAELLDRLARFEAEPTERALAGELGALLVPAELFRDTSKLYVILDAPFAALPFAALRREGKALIAARPVLRAPRLPGRAGAACATPSITGGATVLADSKGDLPAARRESEAIAGLFKTSARVGPAATSTALFAAKSDPVLHVAVHADFDAGGGILRLHDRSVSALEISAARLGPPLVVLSACSTARSDDPELAGSLSAAFLANGSSQVIATLRPISDTGALHLTGRFYREGGLADPVRTLARIQAELAGSDNKDWPHFAVFGSEACEIAAPGAVRRPGAR